MRTHPDRPLRVLWEYSRDESTAALTSLLLMIQPVGSVALAAAIFGESPSALQLLGVSCVLFALIVATAPRRVLRPQEPGMLVGALRPSRFRTRS